MYTTDSKIFHAIRIIIDLATFVFDPHLLGVCFKPDDVFQQDGDGCRM